MSISRCSCEPHDDMIGEIYGPTGNSPIKSQYAQCYIITRIGKVKVFAKKLQMYEVLQPNGNGYFNHDNLGIVTIEQPLTTFGDEISCSIFRFQHHDNVITTIRHKNMVLNPIDKDIILHILTPESSVFEKV
ncbi:MAG TPA: hypothetical protein VLG50_05125 [Candidatus Saccharimonadales bacterium]|nr:hypothetical protein [Candidatus Saccharimonadales bacterium]